MFAFDYLTKISNKSPTVLGLTPLSMPSSLSGGGWWLNCALCDTNLKFGTMIKYDLTNIFRNRTITDSSRIKNGGHFEKWPPTIFISHLFQPLIFLES